MTEKATEKDFMEYEKRKRMSRIKNAIFYLNNCIIRNNDWNEDDWQMHEYMHELNVDIFWEHSEEVMRGDDETLKEQCKSWAIDCNMKWDGTAWIDVDEE